MSSIEKAVDKLDRQFAVRQKLKQTEYCSHEQLADSGSPKFDRRIPDVVLIGEKRTIGTGRRSRVVDLPEHESDSLPNSSKKSGARLASASQDATGAINSAAENVDMVLVPATLSQSGSRDAANASMVDQTYQVAKRAVGNDAAAKSNVAQPVAGEGLAADDSDNKPNRLDIPFDRLAASHMITPKDTRGTIAEEYRAIKRPLLAYIDRDLREDGDCSNLIMVTSCLPGDGKTYSALNLAMSLATEQDRSVLFIDADVIKASASDLLGIDNDCPGFCDLLVDDNISFKDVVQQTNVDNLRVISAGTDQENYTELMSGNRMAELARQLSETYSDRVVIFDSPPVMVTSEALALADHVGQFVFIVAAESTPQGVVNEALRSLPQGKNVGLVLNKARRSKGMSYQYGYGYGKTTGRVPSKRSSR